MTGTSKGTVAKAWNARSNELLTAFRARDLTGIDVLAMYLDGVFLGNERCVVVALAIDVDGYKHLLDFEEGSSESAVRPRDEGEWRVKGICGASNPGRRACLILLL